MTQPIPLRYGDISAVDRLRFLAKVALPDSNGCMLWTAYTSPDGYGAFSLVSRRAVRAHRLAYTVMVGEIPPGLELDHLCSVRNCVSPLHLEPVTHLENTRRATPARSGGRRAVMSDALTIQAAALRGQGFTLRQIQPHLTYKTASGECRNPSVGAISQALAAYDLERA